MFKGSLFKGKLFSGNIFYTLTIVVFIGNEYNIYQIDITSTLILNDTGNVNRQLLSNIVSGIPGTQIIVSNPKLEQSLIIW